MNIEYVGQQNIFLNGEPSKSFFKSGYKTYTNFGMQKFRIDYNGNQSLSTNNETTFEFEIKRYADILMDAYLSVDLPSIWSSILPPKTTEELTELQESAIVQYGDSDITLEQRWAPYEFRWIRDIGAKMIRRISITSGNQKLQEYSGDALLAYVQRDFSNTKKDLFDKMIGEIPELNDPANAQGRVNMYPNAYYNESVSSSQPSISGKTLNIPLNAWFGLKSQQGYPLISSNKNELKIFITFAPINHLYQIRDVMDEVNNFPYVAPNSNNDYMQMYRFLQQPPSVELLQEDYTNRNNVWDPAIHLVCTQAFIPEIERQLFVKYEQKYLIKQIREHIFRNLFELSSHKLESFGMISSNLFYLQRSDVNLRNEWSNYTNYPYNYPPIPMEAAPSSGTYPIIRETSGGGTEIVYIGPGVQADGTQTGYIITPTYNPQNNPDILVTMAILLNGEYRENPQPVGVFNEIEKYTRTAGNAPNGLYCYNYCLSTDPFNLEPSGAINMNMYRTIRVEITTITPPLNKYAQVLTICDPETGAAIGVNKNNWQIYEYTYDLHYFEEMYNTVSFISGECGLAWAM